MITRERLRELLSYDPETGIFCWNVSRRGFRGKAKVGQQAGWKQDGSICIGLDQVQYLAHRLAWFYIHGFWPKEVDHKNGDRTDNRIENLREATRSQNNANMRVRRNGLKGVYADRRKATVQWNAHTKENGKTVYLGCFRTELEAHQAYLVYMHKLHGEFARAA